MTYSNVNMKMLSFDCESNGLHGLTFAIGAVVVDEQGTLLDKFEARLDVKPESLDPWVQEHVLPKLCDMKVTHTSFKTMKNDAWDFFQKWKEQGAVFLADFGWPVETNFLTSCVMEDPVNRSFAGPYPLHELGTIMLSIGIDPDSDRGLLATSEFGELATRLRTQQHHPTADAHYRSPMRHRVHAP